MDTSSSSSESESSSQSVTSSKSVSSTVNGSHDFTITGYSLTKGMGVGKYIISDTFMVGGHAWAICFYPDGKGRHCEANNYSHVSLFIALASQATDVRALFELTLIDQSGKENHKIHSHFTGVGAVLPVTGPYTLKCKGSMWGYKRFFIRNNLEKSDYLKDDCLHISCRVGVVETRVFSLPESPSQEGEDEAQCDGGGDMDIDDPDGRAKRLKLVSEMNDPKITTGTNNQEEIDTGLGNLSMEKKSLMRATIIAARLFRTAEINNQQPMSPGISNDDRELKQCSRLGNLAQDRAKAMQAQSNVQVSAESSESNALQNSEHHINPVQAVNMMNAPKVERPDSPVLQQNAVQTSTVNSEEQGNLVPLSVSYAKSEAAENSSHGNLNNDEFFEMDYTFVEKELEEDFKASGITMDSAKEDNCVTMKSKV